MTTEPRRRVRVSLALFSVVVLLAGGALALAPLKGSEKGVKPVPKADASWADVDRFVKEQKYEEAAKAAETILATAKAKGNEADWTKALVTVTQLRIGLHGYETAVRRLSEEPWPKGPMSQAQLGLLYGHSLVTYQRAYSWEIGQRERVDTKGAVDLKAWTREQILAEALKAALEVWGMREALGKEPVTAAELVVDPNSYPKEIRGTLRDAVSYLLVDLLADTAGWTPEQSNEIWRLDLGALLRGEASEAAQVDLAAPAVHPLTKIGAVLADLEGWHSGAGRKGAQLEARLERVRRLSASFTEERENARIRKDLEGRLPAFRSDSWWAMGKAEVADLHQRGNRPNRRVNARREAEEGRAAYPSSLGGQRCLSIVKAIEAPEVRLQAMAVDGPGKRSLEVSHRNLASLHFRALKLDVEKRIEGSKDWSALPTSDDMRKLVIDSADGGVEGGPAADARLRDAPDVRHPSRERAGFLRRPRVGPEGLRRGRQRRRRDEPLRFRPRARREAGIRDGRRCSPRSLWSHGKPGLRRRGRTLALRLEGRAPQGRGEEDGRGRSGLVRLEGEDGKLLPPPREEGRSRHVRRPAGRVLPAGKRGKPDGVAPLTDRSIYRPGQKLYWKVLAYEGSQEEAGSSPRRRHPSPSGSSTRTARGRDALGLDERLRHGGGRVRRPDGAPPRRLEARELALG